MKNRPTPLGLWWSIPLICIPATAHADAILPYMVVPWGQVFLLPIVILIEAIILWSLLHGRFRSTLFQSFVANLTSTILGVVLYVATMPLIGDRLFEWWFKGGFSSEAIRSACIALTFAVVLWTISWLSETFVIARMRKTSSMKKISFPCAVANVASYTLLLTLAIWFGKPSTSVESNVDTNRNSTNIETFLKPNERFPYIGFWKTHCTDTFGLVIEATPDGRYTVAFCGPGGCDKTEHLQHTSLTDDPTYRIIDQNTIEMRWLSGPDAIHHRCGPST